MSEPAVPDFGPRALRPYRPLQGFLPAFTWGVRLALGRRRRLILVGLFAALVGFLVGTQGGVQSSKTTEDLAFDLWEALDESLLRFVIPLVALTLVAGAFQREIADRTLVFHLVRPISRRTLFLARFLAGVVVAIPVGLVPVWTAMGFSGVDLPASTWAGAGLAVAMGILATGAVYYLLAAWLKFGTIAGLVYTFVIDAFVQGASGSMQKLSAMFYVRSVHHDLTDDVFAGLSPRVAHEIARTKPLFEDGEGAIAGGKLLPDADRIDWLATGDAVAVLLVITAAVLAFGLVLVSRRDYSLKE